MPKIIKPRTEARVPNAVGRLQHAIVTAVTNQNSITARIGRTASSFTRTAFNELWTPVTVPGTPTNVASSAVGSTVTVTWTAPSNGGSAITAYVIQRSPDGTNWTTVADTDGNATNATATLTSQADATYTYRVAATNSVGTGSYGTSGSVVVSSVTVPGTPTSVAASASGSTVTVTWTAPSNGGAAITSYTIQRSPDSTNWTTVSDTDGNATNATATLTSQANGTYTYRVAATNSVGTGSYGVSGSVVVNVATVPAAPSAFAQSGYAQQIGSGPVTISWTAPNNGGAAITSYSIVYRWLSNDGYDTVLATLHTTSQAGTSYTIAEATSHSFGPGSAQEGTQPRWSFGDFYYRVTVSATNSVGTGTAGTYSFSTGGGS